MLDQAAVLRGSVTAPDSPRTPTVRLFELSNPNLGTYSPTHFVKATTAAQAVQQIRENKHRLDQVAVVSDDIPSTTGTARDVGDDRRARRSAGPRDERWDGPHPLPGAVFPLPRRGQWRCRPACPRQSLSDPAVLRPCGRRPA